MHIFWQRRINADDAPTPYWYPCQTNGGAIREDRLVFPIPPGTHWRDIRPADVHALRTAAADAPARALPVADAEPKTARGAVKPVVGAMIKQSATAAGGLRFPAPEGPAVAKGSRTRATKPPNTVRIDPKLIMAARELRDRYLERVNEASFLPGSAGRSAKYEIARPRNAAPAVRKLLAGQVDQPCASTAAISRGQRRL